ncbi:MAG TPA: glycerol kinase GlpK [Gemmatimonadaceae bacterium]
MTVLAIDQGTTGSTCLVIGEDGRIAGRGYREVTQHYPRPGWVEHDADEILARTVEAGREALARTNAAPRAIGITNQRETVVVWDRKSGKPIGPAIVWQDRRTASRCAELAPEAERIARLTGLVIDPYFSATKLELLLRDRAVAARAAAGDVLAGTIDCWLIWKLTNGAVHATDPSNASRTMLFDIDRLEWSAELGALFGVPRRMLPEVRPSSGDFGVAAPEWFGSPVPIRGVAGDQQAALYGQGCWQAGEGKNTYGTGAFLLFNAGSRRPAGGGGLLTTIACASRGEAAYALEASIFIAGAAVQWLRDGLGLVSSAGETEAMARSLASNDGVYFVPALVGLGAPHWEPAARGTIVGLTRGTTKAHLARAALEAMAYGTRDVVDTMTTHGLGAPARLRVDGGAASNDWLMQFQADQLSLPVERPDVVETTALGAGGLAGLASGVWSNPSEFLAGRTFARFEPSGPGDVAAANLAGWRRAVRATLSWARDAG